MGPEIISWIGNIRVKTIGLFVGYIPIPNSLFHMVEESNIKISLTPAIEDVKLEILQFCTSPQGKEEILNFIQVEIKPYNVRKYITRMVDDRYLQFTVGNNPRSNTQQYIISRKGQAYLKALE